MRVFPFHSEQRLDMPIERVFEFFSDPLNLEAITPPWLRFRVVGCSDETIREGTLIDYKLRLRGIPLRWRSRISVWEPPFRFVDEQVIGPYRKWVHTHTFRPDGDATLALDDVEYAVLGGSLVERLIVRPDLLRIFAHRRERLHDLLAS